MFLPCSLRACCPSSPPCRVAVATIAAPRYPAGGLVGAIPPARPAREQGGRRATSRIASARSAPSLLPRSRPAPQGASQLYVFLLLVPCSSLARCVRFVPPAPRPKERSRPPTKGNPHFELILDMVDIPLIFH